MEYNLQRFIDAQKYSYKTALNEMKAGQKCSHWIWYIFPQMKGLGKSYNATIFAISGREEAIAYMENDLLRSRLLEITEVLLKNPSKDSRYVMGSSIDSQKLKSSMTLFSEVCPQYEIFQSVLDKYFQGRKDRRTMQILKEF